MSEPVKPSKVTAPASPKKAQAEKAKDYPALTIAIHVLTGLILIAYGVLLGTGTIALFYNDSEVGRIAVGTAGVLFGNTLLLAILIYVARKLDPKTTQTIEEEFDSPNPYPDKN